MPALVNFHKDFWDCYLGQGEKLAIVHSCNSSNYHRNNIIQGAFRLQFPLVSKVANGIMTGFSVKYFTSDHP